MMSSPDMKPQSNLNEPQRTGAASAIARNVSEKESSRKAIAFLNKRFDSLKLIGASENADYYAGLEIRPPAPPRIIKLKVLPKEAAADSRRLKLFKAETGAASRLKHRNIIDTGPVEEIDGLHFSVLNHDFACETLKERLDRRGWLDLKVTIQIAQHIIEALIHSHSNGVLHLRINPANILLDPHGTALLEDFGVEAGTDFSWAHQERSRSCSAQFISPEQLRGEPLDSRTDIYLLGIVLYKMLTDRVPFDSEEPESIMQKHLIQFPVPIHLLREEIPLWMSAVVGCMLEKEPARRYRSAEALQSALDGFASSRLGIVRQPIEPSQDEIRDRAESSAAPAVEPKAEGAARELWEPPSITVIDPPLHLASAAIQRAEGDVAIAPPQQVRLGDAAVRSEHALPSTEQERTERKPIRAWLLWLAIIGLAAAVAAGLIALGQAANAPQDNTTLEIPTVENAPVESMEQAPGSETTQADPAGDALPTAAKQGARPATKAFVTRRASTRRKRVVRRAGKSVRSGTFRKSRKATRAKPRSSSIWQ
jgi:serine/threonine protein kinase